MGTANIVEIGKLLSDPTRVAILDALFDMRAYTVSELARSTRVAPSTASEHLGKLFDGKLVSVEAQGRHRYYRLAGPDVASLLETLFEFTVHQPAQRAARVPADLAFARSCYDHLAGSVAVALAEKLVELQAIGYEDDQPRITDLGLDLFASIGISPAKTTGPRRPLVRTCLDWSERRQHFAGVLPAALLDHMLTKNWCTRRNGRSLRFTKTGTAHMAQHFSLDIKSLESVPLA